MKKYLKLFLLAIVAGAAIGIGGTIFLSLENRIVGALLFTVGLYSVVLNGLALYTGKVGYLFDNPKSYLIDLAVIWFGNLFGAMICGWGVLSTRISTLAEVSQKICAVKLNDSVLSLFILGIFCGFLMFVAVDGFKATKNPIVLIFGVGVFILCGFEHCVADMYYFTVAGVWSLKAFLYIVVISLGNSVGGVIIPLVRKYNEA